MSAVADMRISVEVANRRLRMEGAERMRGGWGVTHVAGFEQTPPGRAYLRIGWSENRFALFGPDAKRGPPPLKGRGALTLGAVRPGALTPRPQTTRETPAIAAVSP